MNHLTRHRRRWRLFSELGSGDAEVDVSALAVLPDTLFNDLVGSPQQQQLEQALQQLPEQQRRAPDHAD